MPPVRAFTLLASVSLMLAACAPRPAAQRGIFDLSNVPTGNAPNSSPTLSQDHAGHGGSGSFSTGIGSGGISGGGIGQGLGSPTGGF